MKKAGALSFHPAFTPPSSGGELRLYHLLKQVADSGFDVELLTPTYGEAERETVDHTPRFHETRYPKTHDYNKLHHLNDRFLKFTECSGWVCSHACRRHKAMREHAQRLAREADLFIHEYVFMVPLVPRRGHSRQLFVYDAHNIEARLAQSMFGNGVRGQLAWRRIKALEKQVVREADIVLATSEEDIKGLQALYGADPNKMVLAPNGVDIDAVCPAPSLEARMEARDLLGLSITRPACFFIGSFHPPNIEAADIIIRMLAPALPEVDFLIAGKVCKGLEDQAVPDNVHLLGLISEEQKQALFWGSDVGLNPMLSGSGTNLKMLEYLSAGLPMISTPTGARGLAVENRRHALIAEKDNMLAALEELLSDGDLRMTLSKEARLLAEANYSWDAIGKSVADVYQLKTGRRIIILNDYAVMPAEQGGQVRVEAVARAIADAGICVSLLTLTGQNQPRRIQPESRLEEINVPRARFHRLMDGVLANLAGCGCDDVSALALTQWLTPQFERTLRRELRTADALMLSHPYMQHFSRSLPKHVKLYYDSHNTEYDLKKKLYKPSPITKWMISQTFAAETAACRDSEAIFCVSEENRQQLIDVVPGLENKSHVAPNGVDCSVIRVRDQGERRRLRKELGLGRDFVAVFLGSGHPPNADAARLIIERLSRDHPRVVFLIVGSVCGWFWSRQMPGNVLLMGIVSTPVKNFLLQVSDFALNPMLTGSGTSLKLFDYMAAGLPVLSTDVGARGLDEEQMKAVVLLKPEEFSTGLRSLMINRERCERLSRLARRTAEDHFDWTVALDPMIAALQAGLGVRPPQRSRRPGDAFNGSAHKAEKRASFLSAD